MSKFNKEQKIEIYRKWEDEKISISQLSKTYKTNVANLDYMLRLIDMYRINVLDRPYQVYSKEFKEQAIEQAVFSTKSYVQVSLELGLKSIGTLSIWLREYKENGYNVIIKQKGRYGYRRVALQLIKEGWNITEKTVRYWMHKLGLKGIRRNKRKYSSYKGTIGKIAPNLIRRDFFAPMPNMK